MIPLSAPLHRTLPSLAASLCALVLTNPAQAAGASVAANEIFRLGPLPVTNSIVTTWVVALALIIGFRLLAGNPRLVPNRGQALVESALDGLKGVFEPIVGKKASPAAMPLLLCLFIFIVVNNWSGLLPGVGTIGWSSEGADGVRHFDPWIRPFSADMNGTLALALVSMAVWLYLVLRYAGPGLLFHDLFGNKADRREVPAAIYHFLTLIFLAVGCIEVISILIRPVSLSFRLFGNVFGGENLLHGTYFVFPFYFLELLIGLVQALVFTLLVSVYIGLICNHGDDHEHKEGAPAHH